MDLAHQAPLSMMFPRQEYWSGLPFPSPDNLPDPGIKPTSPALAGGLLNTAIWKAQRWVTGYYLLNKFTA